MTECLAITILLRLMIRLETETVYNRLPGDAMLPEIKCAPNLRDCGITLNII